MSAPPILLSGFSDEVSAEKKLDQQFSIFAALGLRYFTVRFLNLGSGVQNVISLTDGEIEFVRQKMAEYGMSVSSIGSPIGKIKLLDVDDKTNNPFREFSEYLNVEVARTCQIAHRFNTKLIRGFSFYHPKGENYEGYVHQAIDRIGQIAELCQREELMFGLEVEANLVGQNGHVLSEIYRQINSPALLLIFDGGNLAMQGFTSREIFDQYQAMKPGLGWLHIKDYRFSSKSGIGEAGHVDEATVKDFVPPNEGDSDHEAILKDFVTYLPELHKRMISKGVPGVFVDLEPHLRGGGQFGGFSGSDGFGVAFRSLCSLCDRCGIEYRLRDFNDIRQA